MSEIDSTYALDYVSREGDIYPGPERLERGKTSASRLYSAASHFTFLGVHPFAWARTITKEQ
jgi:hypothetical protein